MLTMQVDPNAKLIYNDNKVEGAGLSNGRSAKADAMYEMLKGKSEREGGRGLEDMGRPNALRVIFPSVRSEKEISSLVALPSFTIRWWWRSAMTYTAQYRPHVQWKSIYCLIRRRKS